MPYEVRWTELKDLFRQKVGDVLYCEVFERDGKSLGVGTMEFRLVSDARRAVEIMNQYEMDGRRLGVRLDNEGFKTRQAKEMAAAGVVVTSGSNGNGKSYNDDDDYNERRHNNSNSNSNKTSSRDEVRRRSNSRTRGDRDRNHVSSSSKDNHHHHSSSSSSKRDSSSQQQSNNNNNNANNANNESATILALATALLGKLKIKINFIILVRENKQVHIHFYNSIYGLECLGERKKKKEKYFYLPEKKKNPIIV